MEALDLTKPEGLQSPHVEPGWRLFARQAIELNEVPTAGFHIQNMKLKKNVAAAGNSDRPLWLPEVNSETVDLIQKVSIMEPPYQVPTVH